MTARHHVPSQHRCEFWTAERCHITEILNDPAVPGLSLARARVEPGVTTQRHALTVDETYVIEAGLGVMEVGGDVFAVAPGDSVVIPAGTPQRIRNSGAIDLVFLCVCRPRFLPESYESLE